MTKKSEQPIENKVEVVDISSIHPHPRNYKEHPDDQLEHIIESIKEFGIYKNVVVTTDGTVLAGHGVVKAANKMGLKTIPVVRVAIDPNSPQALKLLAGDNEISHLGVIDDRLLTELLKEVGDSDPLGLLGTGFDKLMLANLVMITRPDSEIKDFDAAAQWVGLPEYDEGEKPLQIIVSFRNEQDRDEFVKKSGIGLSKAGDNHNWSAWYPPKEKNDLSSVKFEG